MNNDKISNDELDVEGLAELRQQFPFNPLIGYLNINFLHHKIDSLRELLKISPLEILCVDETKLDNSFPDQQFQIEGFQYPPFRRDRNKFGGGKIVYVKESLITNRITELETVESETICLELTISNKKWFLMFVYRPPNESNKEVFFKEITNSLDKAINKYDNVFVAGDFNIDFSCLNKDRNNYLHDFLDNFSLQNIVNLKTCFKSVGGTILDIMLTNKPRCFQKTSTITTGLSDCHKMVITFLKAHFKKLPPKKIIYRNYKNFDQNAFLYDLDQNMIKGKFYNKELNAYHEFSEVFRNTANKHAPLKEKTVRGNDAPFMTKNLRKAIMNRSRLKHKYIKYPSRENFIAFKKMKNQCNSLCKKTKKQFFKNSCEKGITTNKEFWNLVKPFLTNKGSFSNDIITIKDEKGNFIDDEKELVEMFNNHYINIVEKTSGKPPEESYTKSYTNNGDIVLQIIRKYENHPSIQTIKSNIDSQLRFKLPKAKVSDINSLLKGINIKKATGPDTIPPKFLKMSADIIDSHLCNIINMDIDEDDFSDGGKIASVRPMYKKKSRNKIENYRPVSILNAFSKIYEKYIQNSLTPFVDKILSVFISAYRKTYSSNHVLIRLIENWKKSLDCKKFVGAVLMDLSKAFDCIPHDLLIAKMHAYGFEFNTLVFFYSYLKNRKQNVKINNTHSIFQILLSGVPQGSILGPILFNIFINDLLLSINNSELHNFADDNTITCTSESLEDLVRSLEIESNKATEWFKSNNMIVNPEKFQAIIIDRKGQSNNPTKLIIDGKEINSENCVTLLGLEIDSKLSFDKHISKLSNKCAGILNALIRLKRFLGFEEKKILVNSFIYGNFNYCPLVWHFCSKSSRNKIENIQKRALRFLLNDYESDYNTLLQKSDKCTMEIRRIRTLALETFKTINNLNPSFMNNLFNIRKSSNRRENNLEIPRRNTVKFGDNSITCLGPHIWNSLPQNVKSEHSYERFKEFIETWYGPQCNCSLCVSLKETKFIL